MYLGIEIGGTKLQIGVGPGDGTIAGLWRGSIDASSGAAGIRNQILAAIPELLNAQRIALTRVKAAGIGFGGPIDDDRGCVITSHQIPGWTDFPLPAWLNGKLHVPVRMGNDADVAGLAEAVYGAGKGTSPIFYMTIGSGIGGGLIIDGTIYRAAGRGAAEVGHLQLPDQWTGTGLATLEDQASGWGIERRVRKRLTTHADSLIFSLAGHAPATTHHVAEAARRGDTFALQVLEHARSAIAEALCAVITLNCPRRIVIGGGVSLLGEDLFFAPLRQAVAERVFQPFSGLTTIVPAALGEAVVVHGALALARGEGACASKSAE